MKKYYIKKCWDIKKGNLYKGESFKGFLNFDSKNSFSYSYNNFYKSLEASLKKNKLIKIKKEKIKILY